MHDTNFTDCCRHGNATPDIQFQVNSRQCCFNANSGQDHSHSFEDVERMKGVFKFVPRWSLLSPLLLQHILHLAVRHTLACSKEHLVHTKNLHWFELRGVRYPYSLNFHITSCRCASSISTPRFLLLLANLPYLIQA